MVLVNFWRYPDPYQRFLIRIRIRHNDTDPTGSGSETLIEIIENILYLTNFQVHFYILNIEIIENILYLTNFQVHFYSRMGHKFSRLINSINQKISCLIYNTFCIFHFYRKKFCQLHFCPSCIKK